MLLLVKAFSIEESAAFCRRFGFVLGIHKNKLTASLIINVIAGMSLLAMFISQNTGKI